MHTLLRWKTSTDTHSEQAGIAEVFAFFYEKLYTGKKTVKGPDTAKTQLQPFTQKELTEALKKMSKGKAADDSGTVAEMLRALIRNKGRPTEWALQVRKDLEVLVCQVSGHLTPEELSRMAINSTDAQWDTVVRKLFWDTSCVDPERHVDTITSSSITCTECIGTTGETRQIMSVKALPCHQRTKHGFRNPMRFFADDDGVCGACGTNLRTRLRLLDHLSDAQRTHCRDVCNGGTVTKLT